jgi:hypothetical protein
MRTASSQASRTTAPPPRHTGSYRHDRAAGRIRREAGEHRS